MTSFYVASAIRYPVPIHRPDAYAELSLSPGSLLSAEALAKHICSLPLAPHLTDEEVARVRTSIEEFNPAGDVAT